MNQNHENLNFLTDKKIELNDKFHTYRIRMARLSAVQASYLIDFKDTINKTILNDNNLFKDDCSFKNDLKKNCEDVFFYYKSIFFGPVQYGFSSKNKKIDEIYAIRLIENWKYRQSEIDECIKKFLKNDWTVQRLDPIIRAILRIAAAESIISSKETGNSIIVSEYTNIAANFFTSKMIGFVNGIVENILKSIRV